MTRRWLFLSIAMLAVAPTPSLHAQDAGAEDAPAPDSDEGLRERARALYRTARALDEEGRTREAIPVAEEACRLYPTAGSRYAVGVLYERVGEREQAILYYRTALGEPRRGDARLYQSIAQALERLGAEDTSPLDPPATEPEPDPDPDPERGVEPDPEPRETPEPPPRRVLSGLRLSGAVLTDATRIDRSWAGSVAAGYRADFGLFVEGAIHFPHPTVQVAVGIEIGDFLVKPIVAAFVAVSPFRTFEDDADVAVVIGPRLGVAVAPFGDEQLSFAFDGALAVDVTRADDGFLFTIPLSLSLRWIPDL